MSHSLRTLAVAGALLLPLAAGACGKSAPAPIEPPPALKVDDNASFRIVPKGAEFARGGNASLEVINDSTLTASGGVCADALEVLVGGDAWGRVNDYNAPCIMLLMMIEPGKRGNVTAALPASLEPGTYRSVHRFSLGEPTSERQGTTKDFFSAPFTVK